MADHVQPQLDEQLWRDFFSAPFPAGHAVVFLTSFITHEFHDKWCRKMCSPGSSPSNRSRSCLLACCIPEEWGAVHMEDDYMEEISAIQYWEPPYDQGSRPEMVELVDDPDHAVPLDGPWVWAPFQREALVRDMDEYHLHVSERWVGDSDVKVATYTVAILVLRRDQ